MSSLTYLDHFCRGAIGKTFRSLLVLDVPSHCVEIVPIMLVPSGEKPNVALILCHAEFERRAHHLAGGLFEELSNNDASPPGSEIFQVLQYSKYRHFTLAHGNNCVGRKVFVRCLPPPILNCFNLEDLRRLKY